MATAAAAVFVGATLVGAQQAKEREKRVEAAEDKRRRTETAIRAEEARVARRQQIRESRIKQAQIENQALVQGGGGSSAALTAGTSLQAQAGTNIGSINTALAKGSALASAQEDVFKAGQKNDLERLAGVTSTVSGAFAGGD